MEIVRRARIDGDFEGFDGDALFHLSDGTFWIQDEYKYWYHYAYTPEIDLVRQSGGLYLRLSGRTEAVRVKQITGVIESQIDDAFEGWQGESEYKLVNGQVWKQRAYKYEYKYAYRPHVVIYDAAGGKVMDVEGSKAVVERVR